MNPIPYIESKLDQACSRSWFEDQLKTLLAYAKEQEKQIEQLQKDLETYQAYELYLIERIKRAKGVEQVG